MTWHEGQAGSVATEQAMDMDPARGLTWENLEQKRRLARQM